MKYSLDTSALLDGWVRNYPHDVFPGVWENLSVLIHEGSLIASEEVLRELEKKDDGMYAWARQHAGMFFPIGDEIQVAVTQILAVHPGLVYSGKGRMAADPWVIALAQIEQCTVVTAEQRTGNLTKPRIPDVCDALGLPCIGLLQLFREHGWAFR